MINHAPEEFIPFLQEESHIQYQPSFASIMSSFKGNHPTPSLLSSVFFFSLSSIKNDLLGDESNPVFSVVSSSFLTISIV